MVVSLKTCAGISNVPVGPMAVRHGVVQVEAGGDEGCQTSARVSPSRLIRSEGGRCSGFLSTSTVLAQGSQ
jgi:hypothetical protein